MIEHQRKRFRNRFRVYQPNLNMSEFLNLSFAHYHLNVDLSLNVIYSNLEFIRLLKYFWLSIYTILTLLRHTYIYTLALQLLSEFSESNNSCRNSQLTTLGIRQHMEIGKFLREAYKETSLNINDASLLSTSYSRTALSLVSLVSSFDPKWCQTQQELITH